MLNEYDEILTYLSKILNDENVENEFYSIDNIDDKYEYFSKYCEKNFSKEKFKEVMNFLDKQTKKFKNKELSEESLKNISGGDDEPIPQTDDRRHTLVATSLLPYFSENFLLGRNIGKIINLIKRRIDYETENVELRDLREKDRELQDLVIKKRKEEEERRRKNIIMTSGIK